MEYNDNICFYSHNNFKYGYLSNFYPCKFEEDGIIYNCSEQYFMYQKLLTFDPKNEVLKKKLLEEVNPAKIKNIGRQIINYDDKIWNALRYDFMVKAIILKFSQNNDLKLKLLKTGNKKLYEASPI
jgi:ribA/ribD-fused uncharacterized protein